jgi:hypothetical protein
MLILLCPRLTWPGDFAKFYRLGGSGRRSGVELGEAEEPFHRIAGGEDVAGVACHQVTLADHRSNLGREGDVLVVWRFDRHPA